MIKVGIFFGGASREREVSFSGGRTVYDNLDKSVFQPVPIFIDSFNQFILLDIPLIYKGSIRDFFPPSDLLADDQFGVQLYIENVLNNAEDNKEKYEKAIAQVGKKITVSELPSLIDIAFLALHGNYGEDGTIQGLLEWLKIPYTGCGIFASSFGMNKVLQKKLLSEVSGTPDFMGINAREWEGDNKEKLHKETLRKIGLPCVVKSANQGSSIGISVLQENSFEAFEKAVNMAFFSIQLSKKEWKNYNEKEKQEWIKNIADIRSHIGLPLVMSDKIYQLPMDIFRSIEFHFKHSDLDLTLKAKDPETEVLIETYIEGREFSCVVIQDKNGKPFALPPTEIVKTKKIYDYKSKYLPGQASKVTPIEIRQEFLDNIRHSAQKLFSTMGCEVYARIDGFIKENGEIYLNDPNTTSGMMPSSFFFHQAAEVGLNPGKFLTYIIVQSLHSRKNSGKHFEHIQPILNEIEDYLKRLENEKSQKIKVAVIMGGYTAERHISMESGRNIFEKLSSSSKYEPYPIFLTGNEQHYEMFTLPIEIMLKDNADDIAYKIKNGKRSEAIRKISNEANTIFEAYHIQAETNSVVEKVDMHWLKKHVDFAFMALHGRPGEDGTLQQEFEALNIPYNGSNSKASGLTINKFETSNFLKDNKLIAASNYLIEADNWEQDTPGIIKEIEQKIGYPLIAKPVDEGCSAAVKKIKNKEQLTAYSHISFREKMEIPEVDAQLLNTDVKEEWPVKKTYLIEKFIDKENADYFLEVTGGFLTHKENGKIVYEMFEPSESVAEKEILSLEEKFLAGQGQNITPARYHSDPLKNREISEKVKAELKKAAEILNLEGYARIDAFVKIFNDGRVEVSIIEINSLPGMTPATCIFHQSAINGYLPYDFIDKIIEYGMNK